MDPVSLAERRRRRALALDRCFTTWAVRPPELWAQTVRRMPAKHGLSRPFTFDYAPYQRAMFASLFDRTVQETIFQLYSRGGKSEVILNAIGYWIDEDPSDIFVMWPTLGQAKKWSKDQLQRELIDPTPELFARLGDGAGRRKSDNTLLHKIHAGGLIDMVGANSPGDIRRAKGNRLYADEIDAIVEIQSDEGDQLKQFKGRGDEFPDTREAYASYPSLKGRSRIEAKLLESDLQQLHTHCLICGDPVILHRTGANPFNDRHLRTRLQYDPIDPAGARLICPHKGCQLTDHQRWLMSRGGREKPTRDESLALWKPTLPFKGKRGFHASALLWPHAVDPVKFPGGFLQLLAQEEIDTEKSENPERSRRVMVNRRDAECYQSASLAKPEHSTLFLRREAWAGHTGELDTDQRPIPRVWSLRHPIPAGVLALVGFVDVQADRLEVFIEGHGENQQVYQLDYHIIKGTPLSPPDQGVWAELDRYWATTAFLHPCGRSLPVELALVDAGNWRDQVFAYTSGRGGRRRGTRIYASRGDTELSKPVIESKARREGGDKRKTHVWVLGTHAAKDEIYQRLGQDNPSSIGYRHYPVTGWCSEYFFKILTAEDSEWRKGRDGQDHKWFGCESGTRNEGLDGAVGCKAAGKILKPDWKKRALEYALSTSPNDVQTSSAERPENEPARKNEPPRTPRKIIKPQSGRRNFATGWRGR